MLTLTDRKSSLKPAVVRGSGPVDRGKGASQKPAKAHSARTPSSPDETGGGKSTGPRTTA
jgi:hypothetical protein